LNRRLSPSEVLDTNDIVGKKLAAQVVVKKGVGATVRSSAP
jgi:hypothetical protein